MHVHWHDLTFTFIISTNCKVGISTINQEWYMSQYKIDISTNYIFNDIFAALILMNEPVKKTIESDIWAKLPTSMRSR
jgi:hypothetical protein